MVMTPKVFYNSKFSAYLTSNCIFTDGLQFPHDVVVKSYKSVNSHIDLVITLVPCRLVLPTEQ